MVAGVGTACEFDKVPVNARIVWRGMGSHPSCSTSSRDDGFVMRLVANGSTTEADLLVERFTAAGPQLAGCGCVIGTGEPLFEVRRPGSSVTTLCWRCTDRLEPKPAPRTGPAVD